MPYRSKAQGGRRGAVNQSKDRHKEWVSRSPDYDSLPEAVGSEKRAFRHGLALQLEKTAGHDLVEDLAALEHEQWEEWSKAVADDVPEERRKRWQKNWKRYEKLPEAEKAKDREYAEKVLDTVAEHLKGQSKSGHAKHALLGGLLARGSGLLFRGAGRLLASPARFVARGRGASGKGKRLMGLLGAGLTGYDATTTFGRNLSSGVYRHPLMK